jgi:hypothetical protein
MAGPVDTGKSNTSGYCDEAESIRAQNAPRLSVPAAMPAPKKASLMMERQIRHGTPRGSRRAACRQGDTESFMRDALEDTSVHSSRRAETVIGNGLKSTGTRAAG